MDDAKHQEIEAVSKSEGCAYGRRMRQRLFDSLQDVGVSMRTASLNAGLGPGYIHSVIKGGTDPTIGRLLRVCSENNLNFSYVVTGVEMDPETQRLVKLIKNNPTKREGILKLLEA